MSPITIAAVKEQSGEIPIHAAIHAQLQSRNARTTKGGKPYFELVLADSTGNFSLKIWEDSPMHATAEKLADNAVVCLEAEWTQNQWGVDPKNLVWNVVDDPAAIADFMAGDPETKEKQDRDYADIQRFCNSIGDPRLHELCQQFFTEYGSRFRRTAAAKKNHHARRGGLVEHVAQMIRSADALCPVYPELNRDLLITGVLFHDCGKLWENSYPERGFTQKLDLRGELMSHIPIGIEVVTKLWHSKITPNAKWNALSPSNDDTRFHVLHLIASHHGELQFGSPVLPRTPEAFALHYIDNMDAKLEMLRDAYKKPDIAPRTGIVERVFPLQTNLVRPLAHFASPPPPEQEANLSGGSVAVAD